MDREIIELVKLSEDAETWLHNNILGSASWDPRVIRQIDDLCIKIRKACKDMRYRLAVEEERRIYKMKKNLSDLCCLKEFLGVDTQQ